MKHEISLDNVISIYENDISKNVKNKRKIFNFELNKIQNISNIIYMLNKGVVGHNKYNIFLIFEPKCRLVMSLPVKDKIINHFITRYSLEKNLSKYLDMRNCATRKNMGTDYAIKLVKKYIEKNKKHNQFYILKMDISKYFYNIDHEVLKRLLKDKLDDYEYQLISKIIDSTNKEYVNKKIEELEVMRNIDIPHYQRGKGLPIGNMTSQFLSIFYLYKLDHYIVNNLKLKYYVRYMDDFLIISNDIDKLKKAKYEIINVLNKEYLLNVNNKKTMITSSKIGFDFLGYTYKVINNRTIIKLKRKNIEKIKKRVKETKYKFNNHKISHNAAFSTIMTYSKSYKYANNIKVLNIIDRYFYNV